MSLIFQHEENKILQGAIQSVKKSFGQGGMGPLQYDGFQSTKKLSPRFIEDQLDNGYIKWVEKDNRSSVDIASLSLRIQEEKQKQTDWVVPAEKYVHIVDDRQFVYAPSCDPPLSKFL